MSTLQLIKRLRELNIKFIDPTILASILGTGNKNSIYKTINRLFKNGVIRKIYKGKFVLEDSDVNDFEIANYIVNPSYISLESALSFYGILPQFPYSITSITVDRSKNIDKYEYTTISKKLFWGYQKNKNFLIATPEKALADYLYLASKKLRTQDISEWDLSVINKDNFKEICSKITFEPFKKLIKKLGF